MGQSNSTLSTKAQTLEKLAPIIQSANVLPLYYFNLSQWSKDKSGIIDAVFTLDWSKIDMIVRSSGISEDSSTESLAGYYDSVLNVNGRDEFEDAVNKVISSFGESPSPMDEILVQPMMSKVLSSGVAFTADAATGSPYRVIEWTDGEDTTAVTSGKNTNTYYTVKGSSIPLPEAIRGVSELLDELESIFPGVPLDVEFGRNEDGIILLQVRTLVLQKLVFDAKQHKAILSEITNRAKQGFVKHPFLHGKRTIYGVMPDWNPAEIIGVRPRPLAFSLYRELITNATWAYQRNNYGYKNLRSHPLLIDFSGQPYVDVRVSFNSFIPRDIDEKLSDSAGRPLS
jgi:glutamine kinase